CAALGPEPGPRRTPAAVAAVGRGGLLAPPRGGEGRPVIRYLADSTAVWRLLRSDALAEEWSEDIDAGAVGSCAPQRTEFRRSARNAAEFEEMTAMFTDLYPEVGVPKRAWAWIDAAQRRLAAHGHHQA